MTTDDQEKVTHDPKRRKHNIARIMSNFRGLENTASFKTRRKTVFIRHMQDNAGADKYD